MTTQKLIELISLVLTVPTLFGCAAVVYFWGPTAIKLMKTAGKTPSQLITIGVVIGFLGSLLDNLYWGCAWTSHALESPSHVTWFELGAWANIPFRQVAGILAAYYHLRAFLTGSENENLASRTKTLLAVVLVIAYGTGALVWLLA